MAARDWGESARLFFNGHRDSVYKIKTVSEINGDGCTTM